ncbi:MAG: DNA topoisomerase [Oscillospiraceae bacterium]|jgi:DNA gyrase subunit B|nr:DNA topoisomerase [Oscillospiraceae bacterium]
MARKTNNYTNESISALKGADRVRKRPGVIFGSDGVEGCEQSFFEILSNSIDEAREGFGDKIIVTRHKDASITVEDFGRGIPVGYNQKEGRYNWELVFCELYAGGKYDTNSGGSYEYSLGLNGLGLCSTQYASEYMDAVIYSGKIRHTLRFRKGEAAGGLESHAVGSKRTGTKITYKPDIDVFTDINIGYDYFVQTLKRQAVVNRGLLFEFRYEDEEGAREESFLYQNGIEDYVGEIAGDEALSPVKYWEAERRGRDRADKPEYKVRLSVALCFSNRVKFSEYYHNSSFLEYGGAPEKAVRYAFVYQIDAWLKQNSKYLKNESKITFVDVEDCLALVSSSFSTVTSYENQTKKSVTNKFIYEAMSEFLKHQLEVYFIENPDDASKIGEQVLINKRSRENAEKTRLNLKKKLSGGVDMASRVQKFVDCRSKDIAKRELYIVEGNSALGSCKMSRDSEFQAVIPVRGKILNCLKSDYGKIFKSEIITDLIRVLGCGVDVNSKASKEFSNFDIENLRWNKIIICTDADVDGFQIRTLILTMIYRLMPRLIDENYVYIAESPLFEITCGSETYFAYDEKEKNAILARLRGKKYKLQRSKGLGENDADMMWLTTMNPDTRRLISINSDEAEETSRMFGLLQGNDLDGRKAYIAEHGHEYLDMLDIS